MLKPDTEYTVRMATLSLDDPLDDEDSLTDVQLRDRLPDIEKIQPLLLKLREKECQVTFWTFPAASKQADQLSFLLGSCRYPGLLWKIKEADRIFGPMQDHFFDKKNGKPDARFTVMVGDQIYADTLNRFIPVGLADTYEEFQERYQTAFGSRNMRTLLRTAPSYMILDDHEIEDNWSQDRLRDNAKHRLFNLAIGAYMSYQWSHGPRTWGRLLYYTFECAGYPFFVLDTRTQRFKDDRAGLDDNHMLGRPPIDKASPGQLGCLLAWLSAQQKTRKNAPKFIATSSVFAPNDMGERIHDDDKPNADIMTANLERREKSDSWPAYPCTRKAILEHIVKEGIQNVVFLSGDIHCGNIARMNITVGGKEFRALRVRHHILGLLLAVPVRRRRSEQLRARFNRPETARSVCVRWRRDELQGLGLHPGRQFCPHRHRQGEEPAGRALLRQRRRTDRGAGRQRQEGEGERAAAGVTFGHAKSKITATWSDGCFQLRMSRRMRACFKSFCRSGVTQMWSSRRPRSFLVQSGER